MLFNQRRVIWEGNKPFWFVWKRLRGAWFWFRFWFRPAGPPHNFTLTLHLAADEGAALLAASRLVTLPCLTQTRC